MRKLIESTFVTLDGVIDEPHKWGSPYWDEEHGGYAAKLFTDTDALLLGRVTYEAFAESWPAMEAAGDETAVAMNALPKYVASRTLKETTWNASLIEGDVAEAVARLKEEDGPEIQVHGSGNLIQTLLEHGLVDQFRLMIFPVVVGSGARVFPETPDKTVLELADTTTFPTGVVVHAYRPA